MKSRELNELNVSCLKIFLSAELAVKWCLNQRQIPTTLGSVLNMKQLKSAQYYLLSNEEIKKLCVIHKMSFQLQ
jgi:hypothetical protein